MRRQLWHFVVVMLIGLLAAACGGGKSGEKKWPVSGEVLLDGTPLAEGEVYFRTGVSDLDVVPVAQGKFQGQAKAGTRRVEIRAYRTVPPSPEAKQMYGAEAKDGKENFIPAEYNEQSKLTAEVKAGGENKFKFEVKSKPN